MKWPYASEALRPVLSKLDGSPVLEFLHCPGTPWTQHVLKETLMRCAIRAFMPIYFFVAGVGCDSSIAPHATASARPETSRANESPKADLTRQVSAESPIRVLFIDEKRSQSGRLPIELSRQALLAVAREEFDIHICDAALGEQPPEGVKERSMLRVQCKLYQGKNGATVHLRRVAPDGRLMPGSGMNIPLEGVTIPGSYILQGTHDATREDLAPLIEAAAAADVNVLIADFLKKQGVPPRKNVAEGAPAETASIKRALREMSVVAQFDGVRSAHLLPPGPEKERLLAIGYSNLALLTQHQWNPASKIFASRGLIYANRLAQASPGIDAVEAQAYAASMAGLHAQSLQILEPVESKLTPLGRVTSAFCRFREDELLSLADSVPDVQELATVLACIVVESTRCEELLARTYTHAVEVAPNAFRAFDPVARSRLIGLLHDLTERCPQQLATAVPTRLRNVAGLPDKVRKAIPEEGSILPAELARLLLSEIESVDDRAEPSWSVLGRLHRDEALMQAYRRLRFHSEGLGMPTAEMYPAMQEFVGDHPCADVVLGIYGDAGADDVKTAIEALSASRASADSTNLDNWYTSQNMGPRCMPIAEAANMAGLQQQAMRLWTDMLRGADWTDDDLTQVNKAKSVLGFHSSSIVDAIDSLSRISPHDPYGPVQLIIKKGPDAPEKIAAWEKEFADRPALLAVLSIELIAANRPEDAVRIAMRSSELLPSFDTYAALAVAHREAGHEAEYISALDRAFEFPTYSLKDSMLRGELARTYMSRGEFEKAEPHAIAAAESFSAFGLYCLIDCYTGQERWEEAEHLMKQCVARYPNKPDLWFLWCQRTGHGDREASKKLADLGWETLRQAPPDQLPENLAYILGYYYLAAGENADAIAVLEPIVYRGESPGNAHLVASAYLRMGKREEAITLLRKASKWEHVNANAARRDGTFAAALDSGKKLPPDKALELVEIIETFSPEEQTRCRASYGELLFNIGNRTEGMRLLKDAADFIPIEPAVYQDFYERTYASLWHRAHLDEADETRPEQSEKSSAP